jgi:hypothetical protein
MGRTPLTLPVLTALVGFLVLAPAASADKLVPTKRSDPPPDGCTKTDCSLREAVTKANAAPGRDTIVLDGGEPYRLKQNGEEDANAAGDLDIASNIVVRGLPRATIDAEGSEHAFHLPMIPGAQHLKLARLTVTDAMGGGILAQAGELRATRSKVARNENFLIGSGGGGIAVTDTARARIRRSTVYKNDAGNGGGIYAGGMTTVRKSTINGNTATGTGGGIKSQSASFEITNSTVANNKAEGDGGGLSVASGTTTINNITVARNKADTDGTGGGDVGGGISATGGTINVANSIIALNDLGGMPLPLADRNCDGTFASGGGNVRGSADPGCLGFTGTDDIVEQNPLLGQLERNGGPTKTIALKQGSPAIGNAIDGSAENRDQRGHKRDGNPDSGAYER